VFFEAVNFIHQTRECPFEVIYWSDQLVNCQLYYPSVNTLLTLTPIDELLCVDDLRRSWLGFLVQLLVIRKEK